MGAFSATQMAPASPYGPQPEQNAYGRPPPAPQNGGGGYMNTPGTSQSTQASVPPPAYVPQPLPQSTQAYSGPPSVPQAPNYGQPAQPPPPTSGNYGPAPGANGGGGYLNAPGRAQSVGAGGMMGTRSPYAGGSHGLSYGAPRPGTSAGMYPWLNR